MSCSIRLWVAAALMMLAVSLAPRSADAQSAGTFEPDAISAFIACRNLCDSRPLAKRSQCYLGTEGSSACATYEQAWDKDRDASITRIDYDLSLAQVAGDTCTQGGRVQHRIVCEGCAGVFGAGATACQTGQGDVDRDGLLGWQEQLLGTSDGASNQVCRTGADCTGASTGGRGAFFEECRHELYVGRSICRARQCPGGNCTAFHLTTVSEDASEIIVQVHYDYSPTPARMLELYLDYGRNLTLVEARPLPSLVGVDKQVRATHTASGKLRLLIGGPSNTLAIPTGAVAELVFSRLDNAQARVRFVKGAAADGQQVRAMAPDDSVGRAHSAELANDALWGPDLTAPGVAKGEGPRLVLHYSFDRPDDAPDYSDVPTAETLCGLTRSCATAVGASQDRIKARYAALQGGVLAVDSHSSGVYGQSVELDGVSDHIELPVTLTNNNVTVAAPPRAAEQSLSLSSWLRLDGARSGALRTEVLFSHHGDDERSRFGLIAETNGSQTVFNWYTGDLTSPSGLRTVRASDAPVALRRWTHLGLTLDASRSEATLYIDGVAQARRLTLETFPACPSFSPFAIHDQGANGVSPQPGQIWAAVARDNLFGIEASDEYGQARHELIRSRDSTALDPDYSPITDKIAYVSSETGNYEVWLANRDGSNRIRITDGFGDTERGVFARRPRWAPDGSGLVFESNVYSQEFDDNLFGNVSHVYYIAFDRQRSEVAIPSPSGQGTLSQLSYPNLAPQRVVGQYRITDSGDGVPDHYTDATWIQHPAGGLAVLMNQTARDLNSRKLAVVRMREPIATVAPEAVAIPSALAEGALRMLAAYSDRQVVASGGTSRTVNTNKQLVERTRTQFRAAPAYALRYTRDGARVRADVVYQGEPLAATCHDLDHRPDSCDVTLEDKNGDGRCDVADCHPAAIDDLYLDFSDTSLVPVEGAGGVESVASPRLGALQKQLKASRFDPPGTRSYVRIEVASPLNTLPFTPGDVLGRVVFTGSGEGLLPRKRVVEQELFVTRMLDSDATSVSPFALSQPSLSFVEDAAFSPDGRRFVLSVLENARPVLLITAPDAFSTRDAVKISERPQRTEGLRWTKIEKAFACNWLGAYRDPSTGLLTRAVRGALDELRLFSYVRSAGAFASEAARGHELIDDEPPAGSGSCGDHLDCAASELCVANSCQVVPCDSNPADGVDDVVCEQGGTCTLNPLAASGEASAQWVCTAECNTDAQCFEQECLNGSCRFCGSTTRSCFECRPRVEDFGAYQVASIEGCPDQNSFACEEGSCVSECYAFEDGQSRYLCDTALEYCRQGRCVTFDWTWADLSPASFSGLGRTAWSDAVTHAMGGETVAVSQTFPVEITAFGTGDYLVPPQLVVEGKAAAHGSEWFELGRVVVYNGTQREAESRPYTLLTPYPITELRTYLVQPPVLNFANGATGLGARDKDFCVGGWAASDPEACMRRPATSRATNGFRIGRPPHEVRSACRNLADRARMSANCADDDRLTQYLPGGYPAVVILGITVLGTDAQVASNTVCSYEGTAEPRDGDRLRSLYFGDPSKERSNQRAAYYRNAAPVAELVPFLPHAQRGMALLNCDLKLAHLGAEAQAVYRVSTTFPRLGSAVLTASGIQETANSCYYLRDGQLGEPCYEMAPAVYADPSMPAPQDHNPSLVHQTLELDAFTSFGWGAGEP
jgi:hypothetical protein